VYKEFKEFIARGNVVDLAVAVVIGTAFAALVKAVVDGLITPIIAIFGERDYTDLDFTIHGSTFEYGTVISAAIQFLLVALAVFFLVIKPINTLAARRRRGEEPPAEEVPEDVALLTEIRDLLREQQSRGGRFVE
jgi:large conductance mechanosensitive channel